MVRYSPRVGDSDHVWRWYFGHGEHKGYVYLEPIAHPIRPPSPGSGTTYVSNSDRLNPLLQGKAFGF